MKCCLHKIISSLLVVKLNNFENGEGERDVYNFKMWKAGNDIVK